MPAIENIHLRLAERETSMAVIGLGYVGLPLAIEFSRYFDVIGYDIDANLIECLSQDRHNSRTIKFTSREADIADASFYVIAVPTPLGKDNNPNLSSLIEATHAIARYLRPGDYIVYESTVYPGCTENRCIPLLEQNSGLVCGKDFKVGYSPERINPGAKEHSVSNTVKIIGACDNESLEYISRVYNMIVTAGVYKVTCIKAAEATKILENIQRNVNIALMNEMSVLFSSLGIDTAEVIEAASTKWNFHDYVPGLVGGYCIPVAPMYAISRASECGIDMPLITTACTVNDSMPAYIVNSALNRLSVSDRSTPLRALVMGFTYKENIADTRSSLVPSIIRLLEEASVEVDIVDPYANSDNVYDMYGLELRNQPRAPYDLIIVTVAHDSYKKHGDSYFKSLARSEDSLLVDLKWIYRGRIKSLRYFSL